MVHSVLKIYIRTNHSHAPDSNTDDSQPEDSSLAETETDPLKCVESL